MVYGYFGQINNKIGFELLGGMDMVLCSNILLE